MLRTFIVVLLQAIALGARAVFIGRPVLWGLAHSGEEGVFNVLKLLLDEFVMAMKLTGCVRISVSRGGCERILSIRFSWHHFCSVISICYRLLLA